MSTTRKQTKAKAHKASGNGAEITKRPRRPKKTAPELPEKTKKLTLKAFRLAYEAHHEKSA